MLKETNNQELVLFTTVPIIGLFLIICIIYIVRKFCCRRKKQEDRESLLRVENSNYQTNDLNQMRLTNDIYLIQKVNEQKRKTINESRESAYLYLQFYMRSNPDKIFKSVEHLNNIGSQPETEKNWFLVKQAVKVDGSEYNKYKMIAINSFKSRFNFKKTRLTEIADSMSLSIREMEQLLDDFFKSLIHPHVLSFDTVEVNFEKDRLLTIQDYSRDGSLRDYLRNTNPYDIWDVKSEKRLKSSLALKTIKDYAKQIVSGLIYLRKNFMLPIDNLHSGNVILAYRRKICLITGFDNQIFINKSRTDVLNEKFRQKISKTYLVRIQESESDEYTIRKAKTDLEISQIIEILRFGTLVIEMCTGYEQDGLIPNESIFQIMKSSYSQTEFNELNNFINFIFFNRNLIQTNEKYKKKYLIPDLEQIYTHNFLSIIKLKDNINNNNLEITSPQKIELLKYLTGKLEIKLKRLRRKSSLSINNFSNRTRLSVIKEPDIELSTEKFSASFSNMNESTKDTLPSPPPPPPPPAPLIPQTAILPPSPPLALLKMTNQSSTIDDDSNDRSALLGDIRKGLKLKKTVTIDKSAPKIY